MFVFINYFRCFNHGLLNISIWTGNTRKKQRVDGQVEACAVEPLSHVKKQRLSTLEFLILCTADISTVLYTTGNKSLGGL